MLPRVAVALSESMRQRIFDEAAWNLLSSISEPVLPPPSDSVTPDAARDLLQGTRACITGWGSPCLNGEVLARAEGLGLVAHAAGSVKAFVSDALWDRGVRVTSAAAVMAVDVAWTTVAMMVLARKNVFQLRESIAMGGWRSEDGWPSDELYGSTIGLVGASHVGRNVIRLLRDSGATILLYDPFIDIAAAEAMGTRKVDALDDLIRASDIVSIHAPNIPETQHMFNASNLRLLKDYAVLINTARGALIDEAALIAELKARPIFACLDVTLPEPPVPDSPLRTMPNVLLTPHLAGCVGGGQKRLGACAAEEVRRYLAGEPLMHEVTRDMLPRIA